MRIVGGAFGGRKLASLGKGDPDAQLRPTSDRMRESLFNVLASRFADDVEGARVLDLFAGTGALGLEALSRGAKEVVFVETGRPALKALRDNIRRCEVTGQTQVIIRDARRLGATPTGTFDLVFLDPPYGRGLGEAALTSVLAGGWIGCGALVIWEEGGAVQAPPYLELLDERRAGDSWLRVFRSR
ncbi:MAG: 16S rRNA (guanine(966)-N(2))-methyltransferase RsmD [Pseudomonadota bacterium]